MVDEKGRTEIIGQRIILQTLHRAMEDVEASKGRFFLLEGEAGIGKTAIARHTMEQALERKWSVMAGECLYGESDEPYFPIIKAIEVFQSLPKEKDDDLGSIPMGLIWARGVDKEEIERIRSKSDFTREMDRLFVNVSEFLSSASETRPVLFFIDDLHWADSATLQLLYYLISSLSNNRILFLSAYRSQDIVGTKTLHPLPDFRNRLVRESFVEDLEIERFNKYETAEFIESLTSSVPSNDLVDKLYAATDGNPFYIEEFFLSMKESGGSDLPTIPSTISMTIMMRIDRLDENERRTLDYGAVMGQVFRYDLLHGSIGLEEDDLVQSLENLMEHDLVQESEVGDVVQYRFTHNLIREVDYNHLSRSRRRLIHKKVGSFLEQTYYGRTAQVAFPLAYHFSRTSDQKKALDYNILAGKEAFKAFAVQEARTYLESALELILRVEDAEDAEAKEIDVLNTLGYLSMLTGEWKKALDYHHQALEVCVEGSPDMARTYRRIGEVEMNRYEWTQAKDALERSVSICGSLGYTRGLAEAFRCLAWISEENGEHDKALEYGNRTIEEAQKLGDTHLMGKVTIDIGNSFNVQNEFDMALEYYNDAMRRLDPDKDLDQVSRAYNNIGDVYIKMERYQEAIEYFERCLEMQKVTWDLTIKGFATANIGECLVMMGEFEKARPHIEEALKILERIDNKFMIGIMLIMLSKIVENEGDMNSAEGLLMEAIHLNENHRVPIGMARSYLEYGLFLKVKGEEGRAMEFLQKSLVQYKQLGSKISIERLEKELALLGSE